jgi:crotonobetainyl-CoA:carnitine CoA-transferase CaiB-like acyl-CoA transferase
MSKPLEGVRVIDMSHVIAGPMVSLYLAQLGAEVIKVEPPSTGEVMRSMSPATAGQTPTAYAAFNAGKQSLARTADVFIENFRPGVVARYGLDYATIQAVKPDIVYCSISGYGQRGDWANRGAYDHVMQALTGMMMMSGEGEDAPPIKVGFPVIDVAVGMLGALSVVSSLHRRAREGRGQYIDVSMVQAALMLMYPAASAFMSDGVETSRTGNRGYTGSPAADTYQCTDGWLAVAANTPAQFRKLAAILGVEALCEDARALDLDAFNAPNGFVVPRDRAYVAERLHAAFGARSAHELEALLNSAGVPGARVRKLGEFLREAEGPDGVQLPTFSFPREGDPLRTPGLGFAFAQDGGPTPHGAQALGEGTRAVLERAGLSEEQIATLVRQGVIKTVG